MTRARAIEQAGLATGTTSCAYADDGTFTVGIDASDIGTGARTALTAVAADALGIESLALAGHSMGALVGLEAAVRLTLPVNQPDGPGIDETAADVNCNGNVSMGDALLIASRVLMLSSTFPC